MKNLKIKTRQVLLLLITIFLIKSCKKADFSNNESIIGKYQIIVNPLLCSLPSMTDVKITSSGSKYTMDFTNTISLLKEKLTNISVDKTGNNIKLYKNGLEIGEFKSLKYTDWSNDKVEEVEGMVLMVRFENDNKYYEFMGRK